MLRTTIHGGQVFAGRPHKVAIANCKVRNVAKPGDHQIALTILIRESCVHNPDLQGWLLYRRKDASRESVIKTTPSRWKSRGKSTLLPRGNLVIHPFCGEGAVKCHPTRNPFGFHLNYISTSVLQTSILMQYSVACFINLSPVWR